MHQGYITENIPEIANTFRGLAQFDYKKKIENSFSPKFNSRHEL